MLLRNKITHSKLLIKYECCEYFKVEPTKRAVKNLDACVCGLRNTEGRTRENYQELEVKNGLIKVNPILKFTE